MQYTRIISIDPSLRHTGYIILDYNLTTGTYRFVTAGLIEINLRKPLAKRKGVAEAKSFTYYKECRLLFDRLREVIVGCSFAIAELPDGSQSAAAIKSFGSVIALLACLGIDIVPVSPREVKIATKLPRQEASEKLNILNKAIKDAPKLPWLRTKSGEILIKNHHIADAFYVLKAGMVKELFKTYLEEYRVKFKDTTILKGNKVRRKRL